jgi:hypothetical protein
VKKYFVIALLIVLSLANFRVFAQESPTAETTDQSLTRERETQRIEQLRILYRDQVEAYRNSEKNYSIAKANYFQVQTLAALEEAVQATKKVMIDRSAVMITYLELIDSVLIETNGIELNLKNQSHTELIGLIQLLKIHQENIQVSNDRNAMAILSDDFEPIAESYQSAVYKTLSLIRIGKIQEVRDKAEIIEADIQQFHLSQDVSEATILRRARAYDQIENDFDTINSQLFKLNESFLEARRQGFSRSFYERILTNLSPIFAEISRSLDHLEELITL